MNPREQKKRSTSVTTLAKNVKEFAEATAARFSALSTRINDERTHRLKLADEQRSYVDRCDKLTDMKVDAFLLTVVKVDTFLQRGFWSRLNWLVTGR